MKKFECIREIFAIVMRVGFNDDKQDAISGYTKDKMINKVYVKKINTSDIKGLSNIDSIAVTALENDFSDACDSDLRIAFNDTNIGKRVILYANEVELSVLQHILNRLYSVYGKNEDDYAFRTVINAIKSLRQKGEKVNLPENELYHILNKFYDLTIDEKLENDESQN